MKKFLNAILLAAFMFVLVGCASSGTEVLIMADFLHHDTIDSLASRATDVVRAEVLDERVENINILATPTGPLSYYEDPGGDIISEAYHLYTVYTIRVLEVFQGNAAAGDIMEVKQLGGQIGDLHHINFDKVPFEINDDLILFLVSFEDENMPASLVNPIQSAYRFTATDTEMMAFDIELESVSDRNDLTLTILDLARITDTDRY